MAYDIPDKIQYKEKIVFNLTLKQLLYALAFGLLALFSYNLIPFKGDARFALPAAFGVMGFGFIQLGWEKAVRNRWAYLFGIREGGALDPRVQEFIGVHKIENNTVYLSNGQMRAILSVTPINFENMDEGRQESVILNYRDFLNQLTHPIQILVRTVNVDMADYFSNHDDRVERTNNQQLKNLYKDFKLFEQKYVSDNRVKERLYYLIVPYNPADSFARRNKGPFEVFKEGIRAIVRREGLEKLAAAEDESNRNELADRAAIIQQKLANCTLVSRRLTSNELISLFMSYFDGYVEVDEDYLSRVVVAKSFFEKEGGEKDGKKEGQETEETGSAQAQTQGNVHAHRKEGGHGRKAKPKFRLYHSKRR